jgi:hypothetical protein
MTWRSDPLEGSLFWLASHDGSPLVCQHLEDRCRDTDTVSQTVVSILQVLPIDASECQSPLSNHIPAALWWKTPLGPTPRDSFDRVPIRVFERSSVAAISRQELAAS